MGGGGEKENTGMEPLRLQDEGKVAKGQIVELTPC